MFSGASPSARHHQGDSDFIGDDHALHLLLSLTPARGTGIVYLSELEDLV